jgi:phosphatidylinositol alpha-1,6-mannosyltransferase
MRKPSQIILFAFEYPPVSGGIARLCAEIGKIFEREHIGTLVLTQECLATPPDTRLRQIRVNPRRGVREWRAFRWLRKQRRDKPGIRQEIICGVWYPEGLIAYLAGVRPFVILAHGAELLPPTSRWRRSLWKALQRFVLERASLVIANSKYTKDLVSRAAPKAHVEAIPLGVDTDRFAAGDRESAKEKFGVTAKRVLCTVSRIENYKAHDTVLRAISKLELDEREQFVYLIVGNGPHEQELRTLAVELGIESLVRWIGFISEEELPQVYSASDLFVLCTRHAPEERAVEGFGLVFLEAQSCGIPVVGTRTGGIPDAIREGQSGWLIEQDDTQSLANIIRNLVHSPESFHAVGKQARERVLRAGTWEVYGRRLSSALKNRGIFHG